MASAAVGRAERLLLGIENRALSDRDGSERPGQKTKTGYHEFGAWRARHIVALGYAKNGPISAEKSFVNVIHARVHGRLAVHWRLTMISFVQAIFAAGVLLGAACDRSPPSSMAKRDQHRTVQEGEASFYGNEFAGQKTASGETLRLDDMTAASRTLPLGTRAQVTNKETGQTAKVRINDRGPYVEERVIDLTPKAAKRIGIEPEEGVAPVSVKPLSPATTSEETPQNDRVEAVPNTR